MNGPNTRFDHETKPANMFMIAYDSLVKQASYSNICHMQKEKQPAGWVTALAAKQVWRCGAMRICNIKWSWIFSGKMRVVLTYHMDSYGIYSVFGA